MTMDDNFPLHAFALLPPLQETSDCANEADKRAAEVSVVGMVASRAPEDTWKRGNADDSMFVLKFNLAHTELRSDIEVLYGTIENMEEENAMLMRENEELKKQRDRARAEMKDATVKVQGRGDDLRREMVLLSEKLCETERQKTRITSELEQLRIILKENERVNAQLRAVMGEMETECARLRARSSKEGVLELEAEMNGLIAGWSTKERQINENMGHVQKATLSLKTVADDVQGQLQALEDELRVTERAS
ncbi:hypothetical protein Poli38472_010835 [Pythium oligandrum]|uniref:Uncharacterized protein n=1 Tax=Pythium oligandrum TaxID=41045 RepID=A0A8K1FJG2_PYTOL|nr:hypothetical protein Poli38472_010835 [Pythium oligandrum]|eukprot:TMW61772.1 hypothetical protein Poli38472_010835 [Pythium oligandrum]